MSKFIAIGHSHWGKADTIAEAVANARKQFGSRPRTLSAGKPAFTLFLVHDDSRVNEWGSITYPLPDENGPKELGNFDWNGKALTC